MLPDLATLRAALDRIIPPDAWPGAVAAGVDDYVVRQLSGDAQASAEAITQGLSALNQAATRRFHRAFATLPSTDQDAVLGTFENDAWFTLLTDLAAEGYYADPGQGGNREAVSWRMVGFSPNRLRFPAPPWPPSTTSS